VVFIRVGGDGGRHQLRGFTLVKMAFSKFFGVPGTESTVEDHALAVLEKHLGTATSVAAALRNGQSLENDAHVANAGACVCQNPRPPPRLVEYRCRQVPRNSRGVFLIARGLIWCSQASIERFLLENLCNDLVFEETCFQLVVKVR